MSDWTANKLISGGGGRRIFSHLREHQHQHSAEQLEQLVFVCNQTLQSLSLTTSFCAAEKQTTKKKKRRTKRKKEKVERGSRATTIDYRFKVMLGSSSDYRQHICCACTLCGFCLSQSAEFLPIRGAAEKILLCSSACACEKVGRKIEGRHNLQVVHGKKNV